MKLGEKKVLTIAPKDAYGEAFTEQEVPAGAFAKDGRLILRMDGCSPFAGLGCYIVAFTGYQRNIV